MVMDTRGVQSREVGGYERGRKDGEEIKNSIIVRSNILHTPALCRQKQNKNAPLFGSQVYCLDMLPSVSDKAVASVASEQLQ